MQRAYGYVYDPLNRLLQGDFVARNASAAATPNTLGTWRAEEDNYRLSFASYDDNGNLLSLRRRGLLANATHATAKRYGPVDNLTYAYAGNRLQAVDDQVSGNQLPRPLGYEGAPASLAGDFQEGGTHLGQEYLYDGNGNLTQDRNKGISGIAYNHLNLPRLIHFGIGADSLVFRYTAAGQKVAKLVYQAGKPVLRTDYLGPYQYEQDSLRFFPHAEGRVLRFANATSGAVRYEREFSFKDHLGNLRLAYRLGHHSTFSAGFEPADASRESQQFDSLSVSAPVAQAVGGQARTGSYVARLNAGGPAPQPLGALTQLAVQKGDTVTVSAPGHYPLAVSNNPFTFSLAAFVAGLLQPQPGAPRLDGRRGGLPLLSLGVSAGLPALGQVSGGVPKGYVRLLVFDADSNLVATQTQQLSAAAYTGYEVLQVQVLAPQDGYVTAYVGNESAADVYFDDVTVSLGQNVQAQETQYDPTGLELVGLGTTTPGLKPLNRYRWNGKEFQTELGLNWNHQDWRFFDTQLGRWHVVDPEIENGQESWTPYSFGFDNAIRFNDSDGRNPGGGGDALPADFVARGFFGVGMSVVNLVALSWAVTLSTPYKYQQNFVENSAGTAVDVETRKVPREAPLQELKSAAWDVFNVTLAAAGGGGEGKLFEQAAGRTGVAAASQEARAMRVLTKQVDKAAADLKAAGQSPATVSGGRLPNGDKAVASSASVPSSVAPKLAKASKAVGGVGAKNAGNTVGCCGEFQVGNTLLKRNPGYNPSDIQWAPTVRPRTGQVVPTCENCAKIFGIK